MVVERGACNNQNHKDADQRSVYTNARYENPPMIAPANIIAPDDIL
jgi:hypothetical protein